VPGFRFRRTTSPEKEQEPLGAQRPRRLQRYLYALSALAIAAGIIAFGVSAKPSGYWPLVIAATMGMLLAITELVARYRDDPAAAVLSTPAAVYVIVNAAAAAGALYLIHAFNWTFGATGTALNVTQVLTAGFGSAALFRTSLFNVATGDQIIGVGPSAILNVILTAADRAVDRERASLREADTSTAMDGFSFSMGADSLLAYCVAAMQNLTPSEVKVVENKISELKDQKNRAIPDSVKSKILGLQLLTLVGRKVLSQASTLVKGALSEREDRVLQILRRAGVAISLQKLRETARLDLNEITPLLDNLEKRGTIILEGEPGKETAKIVAQ
jgi:hypothetical protein